MGATWARLRNAGANLALAGLFVGFAAAHAAALVQRPRASLVILVAIEGLTAALFVLRRPATRTSFAPYSWAATLTGTFLPLLLRPVADAADSLAAQALQLAGAALVLVSLASLRRSFGLLPALREVRVEGAYRVVRHPIYAAYVIQHVGYLASNWSATNAAIVAATFVALALRALDEERLLAEDPLYRAYMATTRWRLVPGLF